VNSGIEMDLRAITNQIVPPLRGLRSLMSDIFYKRKQG
jgi:hypothetical protein